MDVKITLNGKVVTDSVDADMVLLDFCRKHRCYSVKRGCESGNCGLCTVQGADQCGFCNPGYIVNIVALLRENPDPTDEEILEYLSGNLCRCTGYQSQLRSLRNYLNSKKEGADLDLEAGVYGEDIGKEWKHEGI